MSEHRFDVAVAGAGPAGVATALSCARLGLSVALVNRARFPRDKPCGEGLLPGAVVALAQLGLREQAAAIALPLEAIRFIGPRGMEASGPFRSADGARASGLGVKRLHLDALLLAAARSEPHITVLEGVAVLGPRMGPSGVCGLETAAGPIAARVTVAADGLRSPLRAELGLAKSARLPPRIGLRIHLRVRRHAFGKVVSVYLGDEVEYYLTPVGREELQAAVLGPRQAFERLGLSATTLLSHLRAQPHLHPFVEESEPFDRPLGAGPLEQSVREPITDGALLVGDAAGYLDAITGEGIGLALWSGIDAGHHLGTLLEAHPNGPISGRALLPYARAYRKRARAPFRLTRMVLFLARHPPIAERVIDLLAHSPALFARLQQIQSGAPLHTLLSGRPARAAERFRLPWSRRAGYSPPL